MGVTSTGATANAVQSFSGSSAGSVQIYTDAQAVVYAHCMLGEPYTNRHTTDVTIQRTPGDYFWTGLLTSTLNQ